MGCHSITCIRSRTLVFVSCFVSCSHRSPESDIQVEPPSSPTPVPPPATSDSVTDLTANIKTIEGTLAEKGWKTYTTVIHKNAHMLVHHHNTQDDNLSVHTVTVTDGVVVENLEIQKPEPSKGAIQGCKYVAKGNTGVTHIGFVNLRVKSGEYDCMFALLCRSCFGFVCSLFAFVSANGAVCRQSWQRVYRRRQQTYCPNDEPQWPLCS